jgi:hypothetical protein
MHIGVVAAVHKRPWVTRLFYAALHRVQEQWSPHTTTIFIAGDTEPLGSNLADSHKELAEQAGAVFLDVPNHPLGAKWNTASLAAHAAGVDRMILMGSDNLLSPAMARRYLGVMGSTELRYAGLYNSAVIRPFTAEAAMLLNFRAPFRRYEPMGPGRILSREVLGDLAGIIVHPLKDGPGMDYCMTQRMAHRTNHTQPDIMIGCDDTAMLVDIKSGINISAFDKLMDTVVVRNLEYRSVLRLFPQLESDYIAVIGNGVV